MRILYLFFCLFLLNVSSTSAQQFEDLVSRGLDALEEKSYEEAWASFNEALIYQPKHAEALLGRGQALYQLNIYPEAIMDLKAAVEEGVSLQIPMQLLGTMYATQSLCDSAIVYWSRLLAFDSTQRTVQLGMASCLRELNRCEEALELLSTDGLLDKSRIAFEEGRCLMNLTRYDEALGQLSLVGRGAYEADAKFWTGRCLLLMEKYARAAGTFNSIIRRDRHNSEAMFYRGQAYILGGSLLLALKDFTSLHRQFPSDLEILDRKAHCEFLLKKYDLAKYSYGKILDIDAENPEAWFRRGLCFYELGGFQSAIDDFGIVADRYPEDVDVQFYLGLCYVGLKDWVPAKSILQNIADHAPSHYRAVYALGIVELNLNQKNLACQAWRQLLDTPIAEKARLSIAKHCD